MRFWIDALTPKQLIFFRTLSRTLQDEGHEVLITSRGYHDAEYVIRRLNMDVVTVGKHGGSSKRSKLEASLTRSLELTKLITEKSVERTISFGSPEAARVSFGLGIPHYNVNDSPHSVWVARLTIPLSVKLMTPWVIPPSAWRRFGMAGGSIITYRALDPASWLKRREDWPTPTSFEEGAEGAILFRPEESQASYLEKATQSLLLVRMISEAFPDSRVIVLPRYSEQEGEFGRLEAPNVTVCREPFFGPNLLARCRALVGGGGTMNAEASLMGVPTLSFFPGKTTYVEDYLVKRGLIRRVRGEGECVRTLREVLSPETSNQIRELAREELASMEDPNDVIRREIVG
ncbi:MAG: DUF354 domain-containing protein [Nitrososphaerota archaeon]|jgi:predicted glycosyltransferase|nr:DUF354 domain-containing protein [Nitrososphaerota archaeon]